MTPPRFIPRRNKNREAARAKRDEEHRRKCEAARAEVLSLSSLPSKPGTNGWSGQTVFKAGEAEVKVGKTWSGEGEEPRYDVNALRLTGRQVAALLHGMAERLALDEDEGSEEEEWE